MLAIGRGLMLKPHVAVARRTVARSVAAARHRNLPRCSRFAARNSASAILLSEQNARLSLAIADRGYVIETGKIVREGTGKELLESSEIMERYLGVGTSSIHVDKDAAQAGLAAELRDVLTAK